MKVVIHTTKKYGTYLAKHLQKEHPSTKGKIEVKNTTFMKKKSAKEHLRW